MVARIMDAAATTKVIRVLLLLFLAERTVALSAVAPPGVVSSTPATIDNPGSQPKPIEVGVERRMIEFHASEVAGGKDAFCKKTPNPNPSDFDSEDSYSSWSEDDFKSRHIGENNAGMDANYLPKNGNRVFESLAPVLSASECSRIVEEARETIAQGLRLEAESEASSQGDTDQRINSISNSQLGEARLSNMPKTRAWLQETLPARFYPLLKDRFGVDDLVLYDGLVLGNHAPTQSQPIHRDASLLTLNVALSALEDYDGGGTYVEALDEVLKIDKGHLLCHAGSAMHAGNAIQRGERWVFVLFLLGESQPQLARRCHAQAIEHLRLREFEEAEEVLRTGLKSIAPHHDHLLHNTLGRLQLGKSLGNGEAFESFRLADAAYPICQNAGVSMAQLLMERKRPRAALRKLDIALERIGNRDMDPLAQMSLRSLAYGARRDAGRCALMGADYLYRAAHEAQAREQDAASHESSSLSSDKASPPKASSSWASWTLRHLPTAIDRMKMCLAAAPNEPTLLGMLGRAEFLCTEAQQELHGGRS